LYILVKKQHTTLYKNNSGLISKLKVSIYRNGLCLTEKLVHFNPLLFLVCQESAMALNWLHAVDKMMVDPSESLYRRWL
jgi:sRNA-binding regulator protein Hfq